MRRARALVGASFTAIAAFGLVHCVSDPPSNDTGGGDGSVSGDGSGGGGDGSQGGGDGSVTNDGSTTTCTFTPCAVEVSAGSAHTCARLSDGTVSCWGQNSFGQLGSGSVFTYTDGGFSIVPATSHVPIAVPTIGNANTIGTGGSYAASGSSCANLASGTIECWGFDSHGQLGRGDAGASEILPRLPFPAPASVSVITNAIDIDVAVNHTCAILQGGSVACWGACFDNQLGVTCPVSGADPWTGVPQIVSLVGGVTAKRISAGGHHTCVVDSGGHIQCWGDNALGQVAPPTGGNLAPTLVTSAATFVDVGVGRYASCGVTSTGDVFCWGQAQALGRATDAGTSDPNPGQVALPSGVRAVQIASGDFASCVLTDAKQVYCWGTAVDGQIQPGNTALPTLIALPGTPVQIEAGEVHACALLDTGAIACWGGNALGQLGRAFESDPDASATAKLVDWDGG